MTVLLEPDFQNHIHKREWAFHSLTVPKGFALKQIIMEPACTTEQVSHKLGHKAPLSAEPMNATYVSVSGCGHPA